MTDSKNYTVSGALVTITANTYPTKIDLHFTVDLSPLDADEPDHSGHNLINYLQLPGYKTRDTYWWAKTYRDLSCKTASQARRAIKTALVKIDDAVSSALLARSNRKNEGNQIFA